MQNEEKLESALKQANMANHAKTDFLSTISHEIRTPLNGVIGMAQMLGDTDLNAAQRENLNIILQSGNTLLELINDVLDMSKIEAGNLEVESIPCSLKDIVSATKTPFQIQALKKGLQFTTHIEHGIAPCLMSDPTRLRQILMNLLSNAIKFTEEGEINLSVTVKSDNGDGIQIIQITVEDTGTGVPADRLNSVFDSFSQADTSVTRKFGGTGLGLSIVKNLLKLMGGTIELNSVEGKGSRFEIVLPLAIASAEKLDKASQGIISEKEQQSRALRILVAEDNEVNAMITTAFLKKLGHSSRHAVNGKIALQFMREEDFDLVLMDVHMPEMDGIEATKQIRLNEKWNWVPVVGLTAEAFKERHELFKEVGMKDILTKPFTEGQLGEVLSRNAPEAIDSMIQDTGFLAPTFDEPIGSDDKMQEFLEQLGADVAFTLIGKSPDSVLNELANLRNGLENEDSQVVLRAAHTIAGVAGSMCAIRLAKQASLIEQEAEHLANVQGTLPAFEQTISETITWWSEKKAEVC